MNRKKNMVKSVCANDWPAESASLLVMLLPQGLLCFFVNRTLLLSRDLIGMCRCKASKASNELSNCIEPNVTTIPYYANVLLHKYLRICLLEILTLSDDRF